MFNHSQRVNQEPNEPRETWRTTGLSAGVLRLLFIQQAAVASMLTAQVVAFLRRKETVPQLGLFTRVYYGLMDVY